MKFKEIEKIINEEGIILKDYSGTELEKGTLDQILHTVCNKIREILAENKIEGVKLTTYNQRIYLESQKYYSYNGNEPSGIIIKVKKEKVDSKYNYFGTTTYYKFKSIEIEKVERYIDKELKELETIEDYFKYKEKIDNDRKAYIENKKEQFIDKVDDMEKFFILMKEFKSLDYNSRLEIAKYTFGEDYWKYMNI
jgi:hypothetical protein